MEDHNPRFIDPEIARVLAMLKDAHKDETAFAKINTKLSTIISEIDWLERKYRDSDENSHQKQFLKIAKEQYGKILALNEQLTELTGGGEPKDNQLHVRIADQIDEAATTIVGAVNSYREHFDDDDKKYLDSVKGSCKKILEFADILKSVGQVNAFADEFNRRANEAAAPKENPLAGVKAYVFDDDVALRNLVTRVVTKQGAEILDARENPREFLIQVKSGEISLDGVTIISDHSMPELSGDNLARELHDLFPAGRPYKFIIMSGGTMTERDGKLLINEGIIDAYISKPFNLDTFINTVASLNKKAV